MDRKDDFTFDDELVVEDKPIDARRYGALNGILQGHETTVELTVGDTRQNVTDRCARNGLTLLESEDCFMRE